MAAHALRDLVARDDELEPRLARLGDRAALQCRAQDENPCGRELGPKLEPFLERRDAERARTAADSGGRDVDRAVAVAVRLDDGPERRAVERAQQRPRVPPHGAEVDGDLRAVHRPES